MPWVGAAINVAGGLLQGGSSSGGAGDIAQSQLEAARLAADAARFRPVGITTNFGTSNFGFDSSGNLTSAGYKLSPELQAMQDQIMGYTRQGLGDVGMLQNLGRGYLAQTPEQAAASWMSKQQALLQPSRQQQYAQMQQGLFNTGRGGLSVAQGGNLGAANPEAQAYYNALAQQDAALAAQAMQQGQQQVQFGQGLLSSAYAPFQTGLGLGANIEDLGANALTIGSQLGAKTAASGANVGNALQTGAANAARYQMASASYNPFASILQGVGQSPQLSGALSNWMTSGYGGTPQGAYGQQNQYLAGALANPQTQQAQMLAAQMSGFDL